MNEQYYMLVYILLIKNYNENTPCYQVTFKLRQLHNATYIIPLSYHILVYSQYDINTFEMYVMLGRMMKRSSE